MNDSKRKLEVECLCREKEICPECGIDLMVEDHYEDCLQKAIDKNAMEGEAIMDAMDEIDRENALQENP